MLFEEELSSRSLNPEMSVSELVFVYYFQIWSSSHKDSSVARCRMDTLGAVPLSASPFQARPDERLTACLHPTGWYSLNASHVCKLSGCRGGTHGLKEQRVMSELPGLS